ncbi:MAG: hypothetical protein RIT03_1094 [Bacteroidota bacterium]|jgi:hypothetical protein
MKKVNYEKVVSELNETLKAKYGSLDVRNTFEDLDIEDFRTYLTLEKDSYGREIIYFDKAIVFSATLYNETSYTEDYVINEIKTWFNNYLDAMIKLKF